MLVKKKVFLVKFLVKKIGYSKIMFLKTLMWNMFISTCKFLKNLLILIINTQCQFTVNQYVDVCIKVYFNKKIVQIFLFRNTL